MSSQTTPLVLGTDKVSKLLLRYSIPAIIGMTASSLYNIADSIFIGQGVGPMAIAGLAITFPFMNLAAAFGSLVGVGASSLVSIKLGQQDRDNATHVLGNVILLNIIFGLLVTFLGLLFLDPILYFFGASERTLPYARDYMQIILAGNVITHIYMGLNEVMRASGYPRKAMVATLLAVVVNCILNAIFIFGFEWGIRGAGVATITAQVIALALVLSHFFNRKSFIHFERGIFRLRKHIVAAMLAIGMAPFLMNLCSCMIVILINKGLQTYGGDLAIGAYGIVNRVCFLFIMIVMGLNQGMQPIAGYNFGARQYSRVTQALRYTIFAAIAVTSLGFLACQIFPRAIVRLFTVDEELTGIAEHGLRIIFLLFPLVGFQMVISSFFQSIGMARKAIFLSLTRQLLFVIPCLLILPGIYGMEGIWISLPVADFVASVTAAIMLMRQFKKFGKIAMNN